MTEPLTPTWEELHKRDDEIADLRARLDAADQERDKLWTLVNTASGMLKLLDRKEPHESVTGLLTAIADARAARKQPR